MPNHNLRVAIYARVSGEQQAKEDTIASQLEAVMQRIADDGLGMRPRTALRRRRRSAAAYLSARASNDSGIRPPPGPSTASTSSIQIDFRANMHIRYCFSRNSTIAVSRSSSCAIPPAADPRRTCCFKSRA